MKRIRNLLAGIVLVCAATGIVLADNPNYTTLIYVDGIFGGDSQSRIQNVTDMLKAGEQKILDMQILARNGYGKILKASVSHTCAFPLNQAVLDDSKILRVSIDGIWGGDSCARIRSQIETLHAADQKIIRVEITGYNGYGKILSANIQYISKYKYENLIAPNGGAPGGTGTNGGTVSAATTVK